jgi:aspartyl-tRNA(Asn)/glutamyl-tRNA(Gln) amidotransferase subunit C
MITPQDIENLAKLSRLAVTEEEKAELAKDLESILGYVSELSKASGETLVEADTALVRNVMREDGEAHESGAYTEAILSQAPDRQGDYLKVKKILGGSEVA